MPDPKLTTKTRNYPEPARTCERCKWWEPFGGVSVGRCLNEKVRHYLEEEIPPWFGCRFWQAPSESGANGVKEEA